MWSDDIIEQVRHANDVVDVIGAEIPLKRAGSSFKALSPFTNERTPSFHVNPSRQIWYCFSSNQGGDVFKWVMTRQGVPFPEAVRILAQRAGLKLPEEPGSRGPSSGETALKEQLFELNERVARWWHLALMDVSGPNEANAYLKRRGIEPETARTFQLGFCPDDWESTVLWARREGVPDALVELAGLARRSPKSGRLYNFFKGRLMIPITNEGGRIVAFSGRAVRAEFTGGKYVNTPETPVFKKSRTLFGLHLNRPRLVATRQAILCEGHLDLVMGYQAGVQNLVATQGTAFTADHARILKRYVDEVILCFDTDAAGQKAILAAAPLLAAAGLPVRVMRLPDAPDGSKHDPDSFLRAEGADAFRQVAAEASGFWEFAVDWLARLHDASTDRGRLAMKRQIFELLANVTDAMDVDRALVLLGARIGASLPLLQNELRGARRVTSRQRSRLDPDEPARIEVPAPPDPTVAHLLKLCLQHPDVVPRLQQKLDPTWLDGPTGGAYLKKLLELHADHAWEDAHSFVAEFPEPEQSPIYALIASAPVEGDPARHADSALSNLELGAVERELKRVALALERPDSPQTIAALHKRTSELSLRRSVLLRALREL